MKQPLRTRADLEKAIQELRKQEAELHQKLFMRRRRLKEEGITSDEQMSRYLRFQDENIAYSRYASRLHDIINELENDFPGNVSRDIVGQLRDVCDAIIKACDANSHFMSMIKEEEGVEQKE